jgi:hypothetical protein
MTNFLHYFHFKQVYSFFKLIYSNFRYLNELFYVFFYFNFLKYALAIILFFQLRQYSNYSNFVFLFKKFDDKIKDLRWLHLSFKFRFNV